MAETLATAEGADWFVKYFDSQKAQMEYCLGFMD
jgi:hypothetical protein